MPAPVDFRFEPVQKNSLVVELTKRLLDYIFSGSIKVGQRLPAERQLAEALGVGRSAIREAIKALTVLGVLEVRQGDGTYLKRTDSTLLTQVIEWGLLLGEQSTLDLIEARKVIEIAVCRFAAERGTDQEIDELSRIMDRMKTEPSSFIEHDVSFHLKLAEMSRNTVLKDVLSSIQSLLRTWIKLVIESAGETEFSYRDHLAVYEAVARRDPEAAALAMQRHMEDATQRLLKVIQKEDEKKKKTRKKVGTDVS
jgi:GntR family transcriptional repressor for pyruvate dehydrogenase complex